MLMAEGGLTGMYGTVARMQVRSGHAAELQKLTTEWEQGRGREVAGFVASYVFQPDNQPDSAILVAIFQDRNAYRANANNPDQDRWFQQLRQHLVADPEWTDGEVIFASQARAT
jgi:quinol monooxygenase YgiN